MRPRGNFELAGWGSVLVHVVSPHVCITSQEVVLCRHSGPEIAVGVLEQGGVWEGLPYESEGVLPSVAAPIYLAAAKMGVLNPFTSCAESSTVCVCVQDWKWSPASLNRGPRGY